MSGSNDDSVTTPPETPRPITHPTIMRNVAPLLLVAALTAAPVAADEPQTQDDNPGGSSKARVIGTIAGAAGGFALGLFTGLAVFDDAVNSDRKVWTTAATFAAAGGVGGYFIGRAVGNRASERGQPSALAARGERTQSGPVELRWRGPGGPPPPCVSPRSRHPASIVVCS
jgi:hypothetical protein